MAVDHSDKEYQCEEMSDCPYTGTTLIQKTPWRGEEASPLKEHMKEEEMTSLKEHLEEEEVTPLKEHMEEEEVTPLRPVCCLSMCSSVV